MVMYSNSYFLKLQNFPLLCRKHVPSLYGTLISEPSLVFSTIYNYFIFWSDPLTIYNFVIISFIVFMGMMLGNASLVIGKL